MINVTSSDSGGFPKSSYVLVNYVIIVTTFPSRGYGKLMAPPSEKPSSSLFVFLFLSPFETYDTTDYLSPFPPVMTQRPRRAPVGPRVHRMNIRNEISYLQLFSVRRIVTFIDDERQASLFLSPCFSSVDVISRVTMKGSYIRCIWVNVCYP